MLWASMQALQPDQAYRAPSYFIWVALVLLAGGALGWLVAAVLGFARARGPAARWFALSAVCLVIYHLQWIVLGLGMAGRATDVVLSLGAFFNLFVLLASLFAIIGFTRFSHQEP